MCVCVYVCGQMGYFHRVGVLQLCHPYFIGKIKGVHCLVVGSPGEKDLAHCLEYDDRVKQGPLFLG